MKKLIKRIKIKFLKILRKNYQTLYILINNKKINNYKNKVELIKSEFENFYFDIGPEHGVLQGLNYPGASTHCTQCLYTLTRITKSKNVLEIGSYHYQTSNQIAQAIDDTHGRKSSGTVVTLDIIEGGHDSASKEHTVITSPRVKPNYWYPYKTIDTYDIDNSRFVLDNSKYENNEIVNLNIEILTDISVSENILYYDLIFIDGDHSKEGIKNDFEVISKFANKDTLVVVDNIWDERLIEVKNFFDEQNFVKWNFKEFNDKFYSKNKVQDTGILILEKF